MMSGTQVVLTPKFCGIKDYAEFSKYNATTPFWG